MREHHNRGLERFDDALTATGVLSLETQLEDRLKTTPVVRLLEIGCGEGRLLLDLLKRFGNAVDLHGVNGPDWRVIKNARDLRETNDRYKVMSGLSLRRARFAPRIHIADAQDLKDFAAAQFDFVVSQVSLEHIPRKDLVLEESARLLIRGGHFIHELDQLNRLEVKICGSDLPRFKVIEGRRRVSTIAHLTRCGVTMRAGPRPEQGRPDCVFATYRKKTAPLRLGLRFDEALSMTLKNHPRGEGRCWGFQSVFRT